MHEGERLLKIVNLLCFCKGVMAHIYLLSTFLSQGMKQMNVYLMIERNVNLAYMYV